MAPSRDVNTFNILKLSNEKGDPLGFGSSPWHTGGQQEQNSQEKLTLFSLDSHFLPSFPSSSHTMVNKSSLTVRFGISKPCLQCVFPIIKFQKHQHHAEYDWNSLFIPTCFYESSFL